MKYILFSLLVFAGLTPVNAYAHQTPSTIVLLDVSPGRVGVELQLPLSELLLALGQDLTKDPETIIQRMGPQLKEYLTAHIHSFVTKENPWQAEIKNMRIDKGEQVVSGPPFWELNVQLVLQPPAGVSTRNFILDYDVIMHQVVNHAALVSVRNDWENGKNGTAPADAGVIRRNTKDNIIYPLQINLEKGSIWKGFKSMLALGMEHIKEGTDHLLFLLVLLLPAMLLVKEKKWSGFGGVTYSITRLLKIITAFTIGHSITLLLGALDWLSLPAQPVEILIALSILISAVHAVYPIFPGKEMYVAAGFGLIHGLAFAAVLSGLNLGAGPMAVSILGFNLGIETMQLFIVLMIMPWLILLSYTAWYSYIRIAGAALAGIAAIAWIAERSTGNANFISTGILQASPYAAWGVAVLAFFALLIWWVDKKNKESFQPNKTLAR